MLIEKKGVDRKIGYTESDRCGIIGELSRVGSRSQMAPTISISTETKMVAVSTSSLKSTTQSGSTSNLKELTEKYRGIYGHNVWYGREVTWPDVVGKVKLGYPVINKFGETLVIRPDDGSFKVDNLSATAKSESKWDGIRAFRDTKTGDYWYYDASRDIWTRTHKLLTRQEHDKGIEESARALDGIALPKKNRNPLDYPTKSLEEIDPGSI